MTVGLSIAAILVSLVVAVATVAQARYMRRQIAEEGKLRERQLEALEARAAVRPSVRTSTVSFDETGAEVTVTVFVTNVGGATEAFWEAMLIEPEEGRQVGNRVRGPAPLVPNVELSVSFDFPRAELPRDVEYLSVAFSWGGSRVLRPRRSAHRIKYGKAWREWEASRRRSE